MARKRRSDAGIARGPRAAKIENPGKVTTKDMKSRFANSTSYAALAGIDKSYQYKCRDCGVLFNREGAYDHYPQDCMELQPPIAVGVPRSDPAAGQDTRSTTGDNSRLPAVDPGH